MVGGGLFAGLCALLWLWVLIRPLEVPGVWGWQIIGGPWETQTPCELIRNFTGPQTLCVTITEWRADE